MNKGNHGHGARCKPNVGPIVAAVNTITRFGRIVTAGGAS